MLRLSLPLLLLCTLPGQAQNLARSATVTASSVYSNLSAARAIDGDPTTNWAAPRTATVAQPEWLLVDLGKVQALDRVELMSWDNPSYGADYYIDYNFYAGTTTQFGAKIANGRLCDTTTGPCVSRRTVNLNGAQVRYLKFEVVGGTHWAHLYEIEAYAGGAACGYSVSPTSSTHPASGGTASYQLTTASGCAWSVTGAPAWISFMGASSGTGSGSIAYSVARNTGAARSATLLTGGQSHTVSQAGECAFALTPDSLSFPASGGSGLVNVSSAAGCAWTAVRSDAWITITAGSSGSGNSFATYTVAPNSASAERRGSITIAGKTHAVIQAGVSNLPAPEIAPGCVINQVDLSQVFAPGVPVRICGANLAPVTEAAAGAPLPESIAGVTVEVSSGGATYAAPLFRIAPTEVLAQLPLEAAGAAGIRVRTAGGVSQMVPLTIEARAPRLFTGSETGSGAVVATNSAGEAVTADNPARAGDTITVLAAGLGQTDPPARTGATGDGTQVISGVTAQLNGESLAVSGAALSASLPGVYEVGITVPGSVVTGHYKLTVAVDGAKSQGSATLPAGEKETLLGIRENLDVCTLTDRAPFRVESESFVSRVATWYAWAANESEARFTLTRGNESVLKGILNRGSCDPYQGSWCYAETPLMADLPAGDYELVTEQQRVCANAQSEGLGFYSLYGVVRPAAPWREVSAAVVGSEGVIEGEGFRLEVPAGAFETPVEVKLSVGTLPVEPGGSSTQIYKVEGLPGAISAAMSIVIDAADTPDGPAHVMVKALEEDDRGPLVVLGEARGGKIYATLPLLAPAPASAQGKAGARGATLTGSAKWTWIMWAVLGLKPNTSRDGRFIIHAPGDAYEIARKLDPMFTRSWEAIQASGLDWNRRGNAVIEVYLFPFDSKRSRLLGGKDNANGNAETGIWKKDNIGVCMNLDIFTQNASSMWEEAQRTAIHELLHVLLFSYDSTAQWLWVEEAAATYIERLGSTDPKAVSGLIDADRNAAFLIDHPLHIEPGILDYSRTTVQRHGYGAALLLQFLAPIDNFPAKTDPPSPPPVLPKLISRLFNAMPSKTPLQALEAELPKLNELWLEFGGRWMRSSIYKDSGSGLPNNMYLVRNWPSKTMAPDGPFELTIPRSGEYTGSLHEVRLDNANLTAGARLKFKLTGPSGRAQAEIFRRRGNTSVLSPQALVTGEWTMDDASSLATSKDPLMILLLRGKSTAEVKLQVEKVGGTKYYNPLRLDFGVEANCGSRDCSVFGDNLYTLAPEITWDNNVFKVRGDRVQASGGCTNSSSLTISGEMASNRSKVASVSFTEEAKSVCREKTIKTTTYLTAGPLNPTRGTVWADKPAEFAFEGLFPDGITSFDQTVSITYTSEFMQPENHHFTAATGKVKLKFPAP